MVQDSTDDKSTLVQVMAWCRQATSHYLSQGWSRSLSPYGVTRPQCVNSLVRGRLELNFRSVSFKLILVTDGWGISCEITLRWILLDLTDDKWQSTLVQVMAGCLQMCRNCLKNQRRGNCWDFVRHDQKSVMKIHYGEINPLRLSDACMHQ